jgi:hypothetical protein
VSLSQGCNQALAAREMLGCMQTDARPGAKAHARRAAVAAPALTDTLTRSHRDQSRGVATMIAKYSPDSKMDWGVAQKRNWTSRAWTDRPWHG